MNKAGRGNRSPALNCSFVKRIAFFPPFSVGIAASSFTRSINTSWGMRNRSRNSFAFSLSIVFSPASLTRTDETVFFGAISYHKAKAKSARKKRCKRFKPSNQKIHKLKAVRKTPQKPLQTNNKVPTFNKQLHATCPKQSQEPSLKNQQTQPKE